MNFESCIEIVTGADDKGEVLRKNANKWRYLTKEVMKKMVHQMRISRIFFIEHLLGRNEYYITQYMTFYF